MTPLRPDTVGTAPSPCPGSSHLPQLTMAPWVTNDVIMDIVTPALWVPPCTMSAQGYSLKPQPLPCTELLPGW